MNHIQCHVTIGAPLSLARAREAINNNLLICRSCLDRLEFNNVGAFSSVRFKQPAQRVECYICECRLLAPYEVSRPKERAAA